MVIVPGDHPILDTLFFKDYFSAEEATCQGKQKAPQTFVQLDALTFKIDSVQKVLEAKDFSHISPSNVREFLPIHSLRMFLKNGGPKKIAAAL